MRVSPVLFLLVRGRELPNIDVYTGRTLAIHELSREHLIPKKFFRKTKHANYFFNVVPCHRYINNRRSDYRFGDLYISRRLNVYDYDPIQLDEDTGSVGIVNRRRRVFYPSPNADKGMIARNCLRVLEQYDYLYDYLDQIVEEPELFEIWKNYPESIYEKQLRTFVDDDFKK